MKVYGGIAGGGTGVVETQPAWLQCAPCEAAAAPGHAAAAESCLHCEPDAQPAPSACAAAMHCPAPESASTHVASKLQYNLVCFSKLYNNNNLSVTCI